MDMDPANRSSTRVNLTTSLLSSPGMERPSTPRNRLHSVGMDNPSLATAFVTPDSDDLQAARLRRRSEAHLTRSVHLLRKLEARGADAKGWGKAASQCDGNSVMEGETFLSLGKRESNMVSERSTSCQYERAQSDLIKLQLGEKKSKPDRSKNMDVICPRPWKLVYNPLQQMRDQPERFHPTIPRPWLGQVREFESSLESDFVEDLTELGLGSSPTSPSPVVAISALQELPLRSRANTVAFSTSTDREASLSRHRANSAVTSRSIPFFDSRKSSYRTLSVERNAADIIDIKGESNRKISDERKEEVLQNSLDPCPDMTIESVTMSDEFDLNTSGNSFLAGDHLTPDTSLESVLARSRKSELLEWRMSCQVRRSDAPTPKGEESLCPDHLLSPADKSGTSVEHVRTASKFNRLGVLEPQSRNFFPLRRKSNTITGVPPRLGSFPKPLATSDLFLIGGAEGNSDIPEAGKPSGPFDADDCAISLQPSPISPRLKPKSLRRKTVSYARADAGVIHDHIAQEMSARHLDESAQPQMREHPSIDKPSTAGTENGSIFMINHIFKRREEDFPSKMGKTWESDLAIALDCHRSSPSRLTVKVDGKSPCELCGALSVCLTTLHPCNHRACAVCCSSGINQVSTSPPRRHVCATCQVPVESISLPPRQATILETSGLASGKHQPHYDASRNGGRFVETESEDLHGLGESSMRRESGKSHTLLEAIQTARKKETSLKGLHLVDPSHRYKDFTFLEWESKQEEEKNKRTPSTQTISDVIPTAITLKESLPVVPFSFDGLVKDRSSCDFNGAKESFIVRVDNIPWTAAFLDVFKWIPDQKEILAEEEAVAHPIHIPIEFKTGKTANACFIECKSKAAAWKLIRHRNVSLWWMGKEP
ncbi:hypothetical protein IE53DRAFT_131432 [Violaceomyces palustris]|uniref:Uncharacterized protein n=1 Tax=Violaceomyces palustris TaxID=1673888 RepID=A0ACD0NV64_9BASI|nr:hypothetical protein IE53DRAFT_131432 [Violaceomyces palustris]